MKCSEVEELMGEYVSGQGSRQWQQAIEAHLFTCPACRAWHAEVVATWRLWQQPADVTAPDLVPAVMQQLQPNRQLKLRPLRQALIHYGVAASVAMVLFNAGLFDLFGNGVLGFNSSLIQLIRALTTILAGSPNL